MTENIQIKHLALDITSIKEFSADATAALARMLKINTTLVSIIHAAVSPQANEGVDASVSIPNTVPLTVATSFDEVLSAKANVSKRFLVMDALHVTLLFPQSQTLLPLPIRWAFRQGLMLPMPASVPALAQIDNTGMIVAPSELPPISTWTEVGKGQFGVVYRCKFRGQDICIKTIASKSVDELESVYREFALIQDAVRLAHQNNPHDHTVYEQLRQVAVFPIHFVVPPPDIHDMGSLWLIVPYMERCSLEDVMERHPDLSDDELVEVLLDVATALKVCHRFGILHRDVAARNILLDGEFRARLCDFGLSCHFQNQWNCRRFPFGIWPPETVVHRLPFSPSADVWSFGMLIVEVLHRSRQPFLRWPAMCDLLGFIAQNPVQPHVQYKRRLGANRAPIQTQVLASPAAMAAVDSAVSVDPKKLWKYVSRYTFADAEHVPYAESGDVVDAAAGAGDDALKATATPYLDRQAVARYLKTKQKAVASAAAGDHTYEVYESSESDAEEPRTWCCTCVFF